MMLSRGAGKALFVMTCVALSAGLTYFTASGSPDIYQSHIDFQLASVQGQVKPDLEVEKKLLLSDKLLMQVLKDLDFFPRQEKSRFRSFDLGERVPAPMAEQSQKSLIDFKSKLLVTTYPDNAVISINYRSTSREETQKLVETLFEKFRDWRQEDNKPAFDKNAVLADENLASGNRYFCNRRKNFWILSKGRAYLRKARRKLN